MIEKEIVTLHPVLQALLATLFTWGVTALGAAGVFLAHEIKRRTLDTLLGFASGVMIAASFWSLLMPAIDMAENMGVPGYIPAVIGFLMGGGFLFLIDKTLPHMHLSMSPDNSEGLKTHWRRSILLVLAITLHNFPEGLAVGVAFGAAASNLGDTSVTAAIALAIGIGLQNFPEGLAVSAPLRREGLSRWKSFLYGQASGIVEPIAGVLGAVAVIFIQPILPYALSFAAGAMIYVVVEELIPEAQNGDHSDFATTGVMVGFALMMLLDVALG